MQRLLCCLKVCEQMLTCNALVVGVLLLNAVLTVRAGEANSHKDKGWEEFTTAVIQYLNSERSNLVFMLWGADAKKKRAQIDKVCLFVFFF